MNTQSLTYYLGLSAALFGVVIIPGSLVDPVVSLPIFDPEDTLIGAGVSMAGVFAAASARSGESDPPESAA